MTLAEALGALGFEVPQARILDSKREAVAVFDPCFGVITPLGAPMMPDRTGADVPELSLRVEESLSPKREGGRPVIGSIAPLSFGAWEGESLELVDRERRVWRLHPGYLEGPEQQVVVWFDAPVPVAVASWVVARHRDP